MMGLVNREGEMRIEVLRGKMEGRGGSAASIELD